MGGGLINGDTVLISYTSIAHESIEGLTTEGKEYELFFEGMNEAKDGRSVNVWAHRVKFGATDVLDLIKNDFSSMTIKGTLLRDNTKTGTGMSKFFKVQLALGE